MGVLGGGSLLADVTYLLLKQRIALDGETHAIATTNSAASEQCIKADFIYWDSASYVSSLTVSMQQSDSILRSMQAFSLPLLVALVHFVQISFTLPVIEPSSAGYTSSLKAPDAIIRRIAEPIHLDLQQHGGSTDIQRRHSEGIRVNVPNSQTYILLRTSTSIATRIGQSLLATAIADVVNSLHVQGDGLLHGGRFTYLGRNAVALYVANANNHQTTYGVLLAALTAVQTWMQSNSWMSCAFDIYDGNNMVGEGTITG